jgi:hypothetical protein
MSEGTPVELLAEVAARIADEPLDLLVDGKHELWCWQFLLRGARWLAVGGERVLLPVFADEPQFAVVRVLAGADDSPLVVLRVTVPAVSDSELYGVLIVAECVAGSRIPASLVPSWCRRSTTRYLESEETPC